jgi:hypothetical protein
MNGQPDLTPLAESAQQMHELFEAWIAAGFTREEALYLVAAMVRPQPGGPT